MNATERFAPETPADAGKDAYYQPTEADYAEYQAYLDALPEAEPTDAEIAEFCQPHSEEVAPFWPPLRPQRKLTMYDEFDDYDDRDDDLIDGVGFADEGGCSALRAATRNNPRDCPCPTCGAKDVLTRIDVQRGYQCNRCADADEGRGGC